MNNRIPIAIILTEIVRKDLTSQGLTIIVRVVIRTTAMAIRAVIRTTVTAIREATTVKVAISHARMLHRPKALLPKGQRTKSAVTRTL